MSKANLLRAIRGGVHTVLFFLACATVAGMLAAPIALFDYNHLVLGSICLLADVFLVGTVLELGLRSPETGRLPRERG